MSDGFLPNQFFTYFKGSWTLNRTIVDFKQNQQGTYTGQSTFKLDTSRKDLTVDTLLYEESGYLEFSDYVDRSYQSYIYEFPNKTISHVRFSDGRFFYQLGNQHNPCSIRHICGKDIYKGVYIFIDSNTFHIHWFVHGPRKNLEIWTEFCRL